MKNNLDMTMESHLDLSPKRVDTIIDIINKFFNGTKLDDLKKEFDFKLNGQVTASEFALAEQKLGALGITNSQLESNIDDLIDIFKKSLEKIDINKLDEGHPLDTYMKENIAIKNLLTELRNSEENIDLLNINHDYWLNSYAKLWQINRHYLRKENQLFPYLEKKGFDKPSTVMWALHDDVRNLIKFYTTLLKEKNYTELFDIQEILFSSIEDMIFKEEKILWATSLDLINNSEWLEIRNGDEEIGYCLIDSPILWTPRVNNFNLTNKKFNYKENIKAVPFDKNKKQESLLGRMNFDTGAITPNQVNLALKNMPFNLTYVNENNIVKYYNKNTEKFLNKQSNIESEFKTNYLPKNFNFSKKIVEKFKSKEVSSFNFKIKNNNKLAYIQLIAIHNNGLYQGFLEVIHEEVSMDKVELNTIVYP